MKYLLTDCDGVILSWTKGFEVYVREQTDFNPVDSLDNYKTIEQWLNISGDQAYEEVIKFSDSEYFAKLPAFECAQEVLPKIHDLGYKIVVITSVPNNDRVYDMRLENLNRYWDGIIDELHLTDVGGDKSEHLSNFESAIWVEDHFKNAVLGAKFGHKTFLMDHPSNRKYQHESITRISSWHNILEEISQ